MNTQVMQHPHHGQVVVIDQRRSGLELKVQLDNGSTTWVSLGDLRTVAPAKSQVVAAAPAASIAPMDSKSAFAQSRFTQRRIIETMRLGIVPEEGLQLLTVGREMEIDALMQWAAAPDDPGRALIGSYGTGKTHLLRYLRQRALEEGYAVSLIEMDPQATPFSKPKRVYHQIVRNLVWRDGNTTRRFIPLLQKALRAGLLADHTYFRHLRNTTDRPLWEWITGNDDPNAKPAEHKHFPPMFPYMNAANIYCYLLSGLGAACISPELGLKGLIILFDESEALHAARGTHLDRSANFLDALISTAANTKRLLLKPKSTGFYYAAKASDVPFLYAQPSGLKLLFAFTDEEATTFSGSLCQLPRLFLNPLDKESVGTQLTRHLTRIYKNAYDGRSWRMAESVVGELMGGLDFYNTRGFVKSVIEALDICRFGTYQKEEEW